jgi:hypothetical protein
MTKEPEMNRAHAKRGMLPVVVMLVAVIAATAVRACGTGVPAAPSVVTTAPNDRRIFVRERHQDGTLGRPYAFVAKGVNWSPSSHDTNPWSAPGTLRAEFFKWYTNDIPLMARMGVNTTRLYYDMGTNEQARAVLDTFYRYGIKVIMPVTAPDYGDAANSNNIPHVVNAFKNHPAILAWGIGNEWDINYYYDTFTDLRSAAAFTEGCARVVAGLDTNHPTVTFYADPHIAITDYFRYHYLNPDIAPWQETNGTINFTSMVVNDWVPSVDIWALQLYRGASFTDAFSQWAEVSTKPILVGECGADSYDHRIDRENETMQAEFDRGLWDEVYFTLAAERTNGIVSGALLFEWCDEWHKAGSPGIHTISSETNYGQPDLVNDEEWFGLLDTFRRPKEVFGALRDRYILDGHRGIPLVTNPVLEATTGDIALFRLNGKTVFSRGGGDSGGRGLNIAILNEAGTAMKGYRHFDTYFHSTNRLFKQTVADYINALETGAIVLFAMADHGGLLNYAIDEPIYQALESLGSTRIRTAVKTWGMIAKVGTGSYAETTSTTPISFTPTIIPDNDAHRRGAIEAAGPPVIEGSRRTDGSFEVTFGTEDAFVYEVDFRDHLTTGEWQLARRGAVADGISMTWTDDGSFTAATGSRNRFYRITVVDRVIRADLP